MAQKYAVMHTRAAHHARPARHMDIAACMRNGVQHVISVERQSAPFPIDRELAESLLRGFTVVDPEPNPATYDVLIAPSGTAFFWRPYIAVRHVIVRAFYRCMRALVRVLYRATNVSTDVGSDHTYGGAIRALCAHLDDEPRSRT